MTAKYRANRQAILEEYPICEHCGSKPSAHADHILSRYDYDSGADIFATEKHHAEYVQRTQFSSSERIPTNPGHQRNPGANAKLSDEMFSRIRLIKVSDQLQAGAKATETGQRSQRRFRPTFDLLSVIQHQGETNYGGRELRCSGDGFGRDDRQSRRFHGPGAGFDNDAVIGLIKF
jgi:hypothetical protein